MWARKLVVIADLTGSTAGIVVQLLNNDAISDTWRSRIQIASLVLSAPQLLQMAFKPKVAELVKDLNVLIKQKNLSNLTADKKAFDVLTEARNRLAREVAAELTQGAGKLGVIDDAIKAVAPSPRPRYLIRNVAAQ
jgi:hypothetical protein